MGNYTPGPWKLVREVLEPDGVGGTGYATHSVIAANNRMIASEELGMRFYDGALIAAAPELLEELRRANKIIMNALNIMTTEQQMAWGKKNEHDNLIDDIGVTRNHEREKVIAKAEGK